MDKNESGKNTVFIKLKLFDSAMLAFEHARNC